MSLSMRGSHSTTTAQAALRWIYVKGSPFYCSCRSTLSECHLTVPRCFVGWIQWKCKQRVSCRRGEFIGGAVLEKLCGVLETTKRKSQRAENERKRKWKKKKNSPSKVVVLACVTRLPVILDGSYLATCYCRLNIPRFLHSINFYLFWTHLRQ